MRALKAAAAVIAVLALAFASYEATRARPGDDIVQPTARQATRGIRVRGTGADGVGMGHSFRHLEIALVEPVHFVMVQRMLRGITALAEGRQVSTVANDALAILWLLTVLLGLGAAVVALNETRLWLGLAALFACAVLFQVLTFTQPSPAVGALLVGALVLTLVPSKGVTVTSMRSERQARSHSWTIRNGLLLASIASVAVYGLGDLLSGLLYDGYSYRDQWITELSAFGSPVRLLMVTAILLHGLLLLVFGVGIWRAADSSRVNRPDLRDESLLRSAGGSHVPNTPRDTHGRDAVLVLTPSVDEPVGRHSG